MNNTYDYDIDDVIFDIILVGVQLDNPTWTDADILEQTKKEFLEVNKYEYKGRRVK